MAKALMPKWFAPVLAVTAAIVAVSGLRVLKDKARIHGEDAELPGDNEWTELPLEDDSYWESFSV